MHVVVTGFDARAARPEPGHARHSMGFLITVALEHFGHQVTQTTDWPDELETAAIYESADRILVGLGSPLGLTSTYAFPAMRVLNEYWEDSRLRLFADDPDTGKIMHGAVSALRRKDQIDPLFTNRAFRSRRFFDEAREHRIEIYEACERLGWPGDWPITYAPVQSRWANPRTTQIGKSGYYATGLDPTNVLLDVLPPARAVSQGSRSPAWLLEPLFSARWAGKVSTSGAKLPCNAKPSIQRFYSYPSVMGVLETPALSQGVPGWWTPAATIAAATSTFYSTNLDPQSNPDLVSSAYYAPLPAQFEEMSAEDRTCIVFHQSRELVESAPTIDDFVKEILL